MAPWQDYLMKIYYDASQAGNLSGPQKLYKAVKSGGKYDIGIHRIRRFLHNQEAYSLHKPVRRGFQRNHIVSAETDDLWMADLMDMVKFEKWNNGYKYILFAIDTFSKYIWVRPLKQKTGNEVMEAFKDIFSTSARTPQRLITDKGQEFRAKVVQALMKKHAITYSPTQNETKASTSEAAIKTIKMRIIRCLAYKDDFNYLPVLQEKAESYNNTYHRTIGKAPANVNEENEREVRLSTYFAQHPKNIKVTSKQKPFRFKLKAYVRIFYTKNVSTYDETYIGEVFKIYKRYHRGTLPVYRLGTWKVKKSKEHFTKANYRK